MCKRVFQSILCLITTLFSLRTFSQTTTINYLTSGLSTTACVFNPPVTIGGVQHASLAGGVKFTTATGIILSTMPQANPIAGTAYTISYNFFSGYKYDISITAAGGDGVIKLNTSVVTNLNSFPTGGSASCSPDANVATYGTVGYGQKTFSVVAASTTYTVPQFIPSGTNQYLVIWASGGSGAAASDAFSISQITIKQTATPAFSLTPTVNKTCGTALSQLFTITNVNGSPGVTSYTWNLGANSGWSYLGAPANAPITTTTNTITLTATDCVSSLQNLTATVKIGTTPYSTNASVVTIKNPLLSITGLNSFCSSATYSVDGLPCNASIAWTANPNIVTFGSPSSPQTTVTKTGNGQVTLTATIGNTCGLAYTPVTKSIVAGPSIIYINGPFDSQNHALHPITCAGTQYYFIAGDPNAPNPSETYNWTLYPPAGSTYFQTKFSGPQVNISFPETGNYSLKISKTNSCGTTSTTRTIYVQQCTPGLRAITSPNPSTGNITISLQQNNASSPNIKSSLNEQMLGSVEKNITLKQIRVYNNFGTLIKTFNYQGNSLKTATIDLSGVSKGIYNLLITTNLSTFSEKVEVIR